MSYEVNRRLAAPRPPLETGATVSIQVTWSLHAQRDRHHIRVFGTAGSASTRPLAVRPPSER